MAVSQQAIADALGFSRTTITKILNRDPKYSASEATRELIFTTAEKMGYDFTTIRRPFKREYGRTETNIKCMIEIINEKNRKIFDKGTAIARNIGVGGALLTNLKLPKNCLPLSKFVIKFMFVDLPALVNLMGECQVVRIADSAEGQPELGVRFINTSISDYDLLKNFIDARLAEAQAARATKLTNTATLVT
ncbi:MAG: PilZ domain-containing protein [Planctomycetota bacterium]